MFGQKRTDVSASKNSLMPVELRSDKFAERFHQFLAVLFVATNAAYPIRDDLGTALVRVPEKISSVLNSGESRRAAEDLMKKYKEKIENGETLPVDLLTLYLEQERLVGGVSQEKIDEARKRFEEIMSEALKMKNNGKSKEEVLGYVLKQQGKYDDANSRLSDLLTTGRGECEARMHYITAAVQVLYPEDVLEGKMKIESFPSYIDDRGLPHSGHVRAVIDEGDRVGILEGDAVHWENSPEELVRHEEIGMHEVTKIAVKSFAVVEGISTFEDKTKGVSSLPITEENSFTIEAPFESIAKATHSLMTENSVSAYPEGTVRYDEGRDVMDIDPRPIAGNYAVSREVFKNPIEIQLIHEKPALTFENIALAFQEEGKYVALDQFSSFDEGALKAVIALRDEKVASRVNESNTDVDGIYRPKYPIVINEDQVIPASVFYGREPADWIFMGDKLPIVDGIQTSSVNMVVSNNFPAGLEKIHFVDGSMIRVYLAGEEEITGGSGIADAVRNGVSALVIDGQNDLRTLDELRLNDVTLFKLVLNNAAPKEMSGFKTHFLVVRMNGYIWPSGTFVGASAADTRFHFKLPTDQDDEMHFDGNIFREFGKPTFKSKRITMESKQISDAHNVTVVGGAFSGMNIDVLVLEGGVRLGHSALYEANVDTLVLKTNKNNPLSQIIPLSVTDRSSVKRIIVVKDINYPLDGDTSHFLGSKQYEKADIMLAVDNAQLAEFRKRSGLTCPIFVITNKRFSSTMDLYASEYDIEELNLRKMSYMIDEGTE